MTKTTQIDRRMLSALLEDWQAGRINERQVHERAEAIMEKIGELPLCDDTDSNSIAIEVLVNLDALNHQLITVQDIDVMQEFLFTPPGEEKDAWARWREYWDTLDLKVRKQELQGNPYYST